MSENNTYTWKIAALEAYATQSGQTDVVYNIHWRYNAATASYSTEIYGVQATAPYASGSPFIPYEELTYDVVIGWLTGSLGEEGVGRLTASLDSQLDNLIKPQVIMLNPPWNNPSPTPDPTPDPTPTPEPTPLPPMPSGSVLP
jgi:hypothetical protein